MMVATPPSTAASVSATLTEAAIKVRAPDSWRVTVRRWRQIPDDVTVEIIAPAESAAEAQAEYEVGEACLAENKGDVSVWVLDDETGRPAVTAIKAEPVWDVAPAKVEWANQTLAELPQAIMAETAAS